MSATPDADPPSREESVLLLAPTATDAVLCRGILLETGIDGTICRNVQEVCAGIDAGAGLAVLSEEALTGESLERLSQVVRLQPAWSDFPLLVLTEQGADS